MYSLLKIITIIINHLQKKSNNYHKQLNNNITHFIKTKNKLHQSFHQQQLIFQKNTFIKIIKTKKTIKTYNINIKKTKNSSTTNNKNNKKTQKLQHTNNHIPKITFHIKNKIQNKPKSLKKLKLPLKTLTNSSYQTNNNLYS